ncbi:MAG: hypothetical protein V4587_00330 [Acidobacteriota bacterium]
MLDGERRVVIEPAWLYSHGLSSSVFKVGGVWTGKLPNQFTLEVTLPGVFDIKGLKVGLNGEIFTLKPAGPAQLPRFVDGKSESSMDFVVPLAFIDTLVAAERSVFQVQLGGGAVAEGRFSFNQQTYALPAFRKALREIHASTPPAPGAAKPTDANATGPTDREIMLEWDRHYETTKKGTPFLAAVVTFARHWMGRSPTAANAGGLPIMFGSLPVESMQIDLLCMCLKEHTMFDGPGLEKAWNELVQFYLTHRPTAEKAGDQAAT